LPDEECLIAGEVAKSRSLVVLQSTMKYKYHEVPGGSDGTVCLRRIAYLRVEVARSGGLVVLQSTTKYQGALMAQCARGGVLNCA